ncbi:MAG: DUF1972 domain-containing protein [Nitrososphaeria archaeon]
MNTKIAIIGLRGIPSAYGGTETFVEELTERLKDKFQFYVMYEDSNFFEDNYNGVIRVHSPAIKNKSTSIPSINDLINTLYIIYKHKKEIKLFYFLGPDSSVCILLTRLIGAKSIINPDGIEWKRLIKRSYFIPFYLLPIYLTVMIYMYFMEWLSCKLPNIIVADSIAIKKYLKKQHKVEKIVYIPYGARELINLSLSEEKEAEILNKYNLLRESYYLTVARIVAENNLHIEIKAFKKAKTNKKLVIIGNLNERDPYTKHLLKLKGNNENIFLINQIYNKQILGVLRKNCFAYIHAYEVGGTNPSLLEQMQFGKPILTYDVPFNREVLREGGICFRDEEDLKRKIEMLEKGNFNLNLITKLQLERIKTHYNWDKIARQYETVFNSLIG